MSAITTPVPASTKLGDDAAPGGSLRSYTTLVNEAGEVVGIATQSGQVAELAALNLVGTRAYGAALARVAVGSGVTASAAIPNGCKEALLHASTRCFVRVGANPTTDDIPLEAGEKFHLRVTAGQSVRVVRDTADGYLNIVPVAA